MGDRGWVAVVAAVVVLTAWLAFNPALQRWLYSTGTFGERPDNRYVVVYNAYNDAQGIAKHLIEFGVSFSAIRSPVFGAQILPPKPRARRYTCWVDKPGLKEVPQPFRVCPFEKVQISLEFDKPIGGFTSFLANVSVTPDRSLYIYVESDGPSVFMDCVLAPEDESDPLFSCRDKARVDNKRGKESTFLEEAPPFPQGSVFSR